MLVQKILVTCLSLLLLPVAHCNTITKDGANALSAGSVPEITSTGINVLPEQNLTPLVLSKFKFIAFGDYQGGGSQQGGSDVVLQNIVPKIGEKPKFYINTGDIADLAYINYLKGVLLYPAKGNNDDNIWASIYPLPKPIKDYYAFNYGNTHFAMLYSGTHDNPNDDANTQKQFPVKSANPNCRNPANQTDWFYCDLESVRNKNTIQNIFVVLHKPPLSFGGYGSNPIESQVLTPIFKTHPKLRAVLSGHNHFYQRLLKDDINYLVIGGAGAPLYDPDPNFHTEVKKQAKQFHYVVFDVDGSKVSFSTLGYNIDKKVFSSIDKGDLSCKQGETQNQYCNVNGRPGFRILTCANGKWMPVGPCIPKFPIPNQETDHPIPKKNN